MVNSGLVFQRRIKATPDIVGQLFTRLDLLLTAVGPFLSEEALTRRPHNFGLKVVVKAFKARFL